MTTSNNRASVAAIAIYGWVNGTLAAGVARLDDRLRLDATVTALHLVAFATGLILAGSIPTRPSIGRRSAPVVFAVALVPFLQAPHVSVSLLAAVVIGASGSITLADSQTTITTDGASGDRVLVYANVGAALTAAGGAALVAAVPLSLVSVTAAPAIIASAWVSTRTAPTWLTPAAPERGPARQPSVSGMPNRVEFAGLTLVGLVVAIEFSLSNQIVAFLNASQPQSFNDVAPTIVFLGLAVGRTAAAACHALDRNRVLIAALLVLAAGLALVVLAEPAAVRFGALAVVGASLGPLYPLAIGRTLDQARRRDRTSAHSTAAIGVALLSAPLAVGILTDSVSPTAGMSLVAILAFGALVIVASGRADVPAPGR